ncbi:MAG: alkaline phosphatase family protein [Candidatus Sulfotelmatobacter sp.]
MLRITQEKDRLCSIAMAIAAIVCFVLFATGAQTAAGQARPPVLPLPAHVVVVVEENEAYSEIIGSSQAPYINSLAAEGALFTNSHAIGHPSQPNYLALFSGSTQGVTGDHCPFIFSAANLGSELIAAGKTFTGFSEGLPSAGSEICQAGKYARKHVPWTNFPNIPPSDNQPFTSFPTNFADLPTISWVIPNLMNDMHDGTVQEGDTWLKTRLASYVAWAQSNNSLLIVTWDEDNGTSVNQIATIFVGPMVKPGRYGERIDHYSVLRTLEAMYGLPYLGHAASAETITDVWR